MGTLEYFYLLLACLTYLSQADVNTWTQKVKKHKPVSLRSERLRKVASWSEDDAEMKYFKDVLLKPILRVRQPDTEGNKEVREHITSVMSSMGWKMDYDVFKDDTPQGEKTFTNIIATQNPAASRKLIIACHHDSKYFEHIEFIGATDSAVPCAMMLDLARLLNSTLWKEDSKKSKDITLQFLFFDGEEAYVKWSATDSLYGSRHFADKMSQASTLVGREEYIPDIKTIDVMILLDLIGTKTTQFQSWFTNTAKLFQRFQKIESKLIKEKFLTYSADSSKYFTDRSSYGGGGIEDDHIPFLRKDVPILHLISYPFPKEWHTKLDNEKALDYNTINNISKILRIFVVEYLHLSP